MSITTITFRFSGWWYINTAVHNTIQYIGSTSSLEHYLYVQIGIWQLLLIVASLYPFRWLSSVPPTRSCPAGLVCKSWSVHQLLVHWRHALDQSLRYPLACRMVLGLWDIHVMPGFWCLQTVLHSPTTASPLPQSKPDKHRNAKNNILTTNKDQ